MRNPTFKTAMMGGSAAALALVIFAAPTVVAAQTATYSFNIPAQDLGAALRAYGRASRQQVVFDARDTRGKRSAALVGTFTADAGLQQLLGGTGLTVRRGSSGVLIVSNPERGEPSGAVTAAAEGMATELEDVVVTGTHIAGAPVGSPSFVFTQQDFERTGATSIEQFVATLPQAFGGAPSGDTAFSALPGQQGSSSYRTAIDLRGLGTGGTLVLVNGQRRIRSGLADAVDISLIPLSAVERIEVLTDGASAIYGSDAVAGVVNIILRKDFSGAETRVTVGTTTRGGRDQVQVSQNLGFGWGSGSGLFSLYYDDTQALPVPDPERPFASDRFPIALPSESYGANITLSQNLASWITVGLDAAYSRRQDLITSDPNLPPVTEILSDNEIYHINAGLQIDLPGSWDGSLTAGYGETTTQAPQFTPGGFNTSESFGNNIKSVEGNLSGTLFDLPAGPMQLALGAGRREESYSNGFSFAFDDRPPAAENREPLSFAVNHAYGELRAPLLGDETGRPIVTMSLASRYEEYSNADSAFSSKVGLEWVAVEGVRLRGSWGTSFRAPTPLETTPNIFAPGAFTYNLQVLPTQVLTTPGVPAGSIYYIDRFGADPDLHEETSETWTIGADLTPAFISGLTARLTYFSTDYRDRIASAPGGPGERILEPYGAPLRLVRGDPGFDAMLAAILAGSPASGRVISCPPANRPPAPSTVCTIPASQVYVILFGETRNLASTHDSGVDFQFNYVLDSDIGRFDFGLNGVWNFDLSKRTVEGGPEVQFLDTSYNPVDIRFRGTAGWQRGAFDVTAAVNYIDNYANKTATPVERVSAWTTVDLNVQYDLGARRIGGLLSGTRLIFNATNLFDADPPFFRPQFPGAPSFDAANADPYGTAVSLTLVKNW